ncbi:MAG: c-type cytochrome [Bacteroidetes bacterium]|jgi:cytochrome c peroxidase|nr:c-type cytochrome [Bacteroidota bacterium]MBT5527838.1 c-type cytochrome [Cytophagia bacterium]MBT3421777.1 c-type cytochrome [Bacteroidota bacterium]MBT3800815.1 c-type cytochrome [Bacteroidota bacterium]MBT3935688.1 c-type cytochrome [Bacteroidota bacterium]
MKRIKYLISSIIAVTIAISMPVSIGVITSLTFTSCGDKDSVIIIPNWETTPYEFPLKVDGRPWFPTELNIPADNPTTVEGVKLGRYLFYDGRLSGRVECDSQMTCATCHRQESSFEVGMDEPRFPGGKTRGLPHPAYPDGKWTPHYMMPMINLVFNQNGYLWNGKVNNNNTAMGAAPYGVPAEPQYHMKNIESVVWMGIAAPHEMNGSPQKTVDMIKSIDIYPPMFKAAFGTEEVTYDRISKAVAQFVRTLVSYNSKFHKWVRHTASLTPQELHGYELYMSEAADCFHCHGDPVLLTTNQFYNNGLDTVFNDGGDRNGYTKLAMDVGSYKAPTLINIEKTAPYMHDGRFNTLEEVIDHYSDGVVYSQTIDPLMKYVAFGGTKLTEQEKADLLAFLKTFTDTDFLTNPEFAKPADLDTGCD